MSRIPANNEREKHISSVSFETLKALSFPPFGSGCKKAPPSGMVPISVTSSPLEAIGGASSWFTLLTIQPNSRPYKALAVASRTSEKRKKKEVKLTYEKDDFTISDTGGSGEKFRVLPTTVKPLTPWYTSRCPTLKLQETCGSWGHQNYRFRRQISCIPLGLDVDICLCLCAMMEFLAPTALTQAP